MGWGDLFAEASRSIFNRLKHLFCFFVMWACLSIMTYTDTLLLLLHPTGPLAAFAVACLPREGWHGQQRLGKFSANANITSMMGADSSLTRGTYPIDRSILMDFTPSSQRGMWNAVKLVE